jgi:glycosyltransferase 2 family protein
VKQKTAPKTVGQGFWHKEAQGLHSFSFHPFHFPFSLRLGASVADFSARHWKALARLLVLGAAVTLVATHLRSADLGRALHRLPIADIALIVGALSPLAVLLRALRWRTLMPAGGRVPLRAYAGAYLVGVLANAILLGRFGDLVKARFICRPGVDYGRSLSVVVIDRLLEGLALLLGFAALLVFAPLPLWASRLAWIAASASLGALAILRVLFDHQTGFLRWTKRLLVRLPASLQRWLLAAVERLLAGCEALASTRRVTVGLLYAFAVWGVEIAAVALVLHALSIPAPLLTAAIVLLVVLNFGMLVPTSPGSIGVYQWLCVFALSLWGVDHRLALALGIVMQTILFVPLYLAGLVWLIAEGGNLKSNISG